MAQESIDKVITITFKSSDLVKRFEELTAEIEKTKAATKNLNKEDSDYYKQVAANKMQLRELIRQQKQVQKELDKNMKLEKSGKGSLTQMRAAVKSLTSEYENLSSTLRESDFGKRMAANIKSQQEAINKAEMSLGNYRSQVGNYENAIKDALGVNNKLIDSFKMLRTPIGALIGIVGSVVAIFKLFKSSLHDTQQTGDAYDNAMAGWSNTWNLFKKTVATVDFSLFIRNAAEAAAAGRNLQSVIDELFERTNSINIMRASMSKENAELEETLRNTGLSYSERLAAGEKYLENMQEIYKQEEEAARDVRDAQLENLFALTKTREYASKEERERAKEEFADGIKNYNLTREKINAANALLRAEKAVNAIGSGPMSIETIKLLNDNLAEATENFRKLAGEQATQILEFQRQYSLTTDEQVKQYVDAEIKYQNAQAATYNDQKRIVNSINSIRAQAANEYIQNKEKEQKAAADAAQKDAELVKNSAERNAKIIMDAEAKILGITQQMREETRDNELLTLKENYEKETEILQNQIRNDMNLSEEAKSALSRQLLVMEEQYQQQRQIIIDKYTQQELENQINTKTEEYRSKLLAAQLQAAKAGDSPEAQLAAAKQVAMTEVEIAAEKLQAISTMENATQSQRLQAEIELQNAINKTGKIDKQIAKQQQQMSQQMLSSVASTVGAFSQMFDALAGEGEEFAGFSKMLAIFEVGLQQAIAIAGAVAKAAEFSIPWLLPVQIASSIAAVTAAIAQAVKATDSAKVPSYATGGLVTGPGTGTSDSITARLSNGEAVMTAAAVADWGDILSAMNVSSGGNAIDTSNLPQRGNGMEGIKEMFREVLLEMPNPVVSVVDINQGQRRVQTAERLGRAKGTLK